ncbi:MAG: DUF1573 domain-containing protein [Bacteroidales bacterium]|nr:DUF1573 domain-containing protein [Bacteroidales bacterium]
MKNHYLLIILLLFSCTENNPVQNNATIAFIQTEHDFGSSQKKEVTYDFVFSNTSKEPLLIQNVETTCGCTVPDWPKQPIKPGQKAKITVKYKAAYPGSFSKSIRVYYNGKNSPAVLKIKCSVQ